MSPNGTKAELIKEIQELRQENHSLKELYNKGNAIDNYPHDALHETNHKLTLAMQGGKMAWWEMDVTSGNVTFDKQKVEILGHPIENFKNYKDYTALVHPEDCERVMNAMKGHLEGKKDKYEAEYRILAKSGEYIWLYDYGSVVKKDSNGAPLICTGFVFDITDQKKAELNLLIINKAFESTSDAIGIADSHGHHFFQNKALSDLFGYETAEEIEAAGGPVARVKDQSIAKTMFDNILNGKSWSGELEMVTKSGRVFPAYESADAIKDNKGNIIGVIGIISDLTERKQAEEILRKSEQMLQTVLNNFPGVVFWKDRQSNYLGCNQSFATGAGLNSPAEIVGKTDFELPWASTEAINYRKDDFDVMEYGKGRLHIAEMQHQSDGKVIWLDTSKFPLRDSLGQVVGVIGVSNDISMLKMAEQELINTNKELAYQNSEKDKRADELIIANKELLFQNEEKEKRAAELVQARNKAEESDNLKSAFLNNLSHEIRTPMNQILGFASLLKDPELTEVTRDEYIGYINSQSHQLLHIITDIVEISKITAGQVVIKSTSFNLSEMMNELFASFKPKAEQRNLQLTFGKKITDAEAMIQGDQVKLKYILSNLIENAIKFTDAGSVHLEYTRTADRLTISVKDTGIGMREQEKQVIFDRFRQIEITMARKYGGLGLGLAISSAYIQMMSGVIRVESEPGEGSTFFVEMPYVPAIRVSERTPNILQTTVISRPDWQNKTVLIVEDEESNVQYLTAVLRITGARILYAVNGSEAVEQCKIHPEIAVVLMDIKLPRMDGLEATKIIKSFRSDLPVIATTAFAMTSDMEYILEAGCDDYLPKPTTWEDLIIKIQKYIGSSK